MAAQFVISSPDLKRCPPPTLPEVAFLGHSNAGKSSLINALAKQKNLARVSQTPGKTDILNFYNFDDKFMLVDMPGYGFAARRQESRESWTPMIEEYLEHRENLKGAVLVLDIKRKWTDDETHLVEWVSHYGLPLILVLNKVDKLNQKEFSAKKREFDPVNLVSEKVYASALKGTGIELLMRTVFDKLLRA